MATQKQIFEYCLPDEYKWVVEETASTFEATSPDGIKIIVGKKPFPENGTLDLEVQNCPNLDLDAVYDEVFYGLSEQSFLDK